MNIDVLQHLQDAEARRAEDEKDRHIHQEGKVGASSLYDCPLYLAKHWALEWDWVSGHHPTTTGLKAEMGGAEMGTKTHLRAQIDLYQFYYGCTEEEYFAKTIRPIHTRHLPAGVEYCAEAYCKVKLGPVEIETYIDGAYAHHLPENRELPVFLRTTIPYKHKEMEVNIKHPLAVWDQITDYKSAGMHAYYEYMPKGRLNTTFPELKGKYSGDLSLNYKAQATAMMLATGLYECEFLFIAKHNNDQFLHRYHFDPAFRDRLEDQLSKAYALALQFKARGRYHVQPEELAYWRDQEDFHCRYCPYSEVVELWSSKKEKYYLKLERPCAEAQKLLLPLLQKRFQIGSKWQGWVLTDRGWRKPVMSITAFTGLRGDQVIVRDDRNTSHQVNLWGMLEWEAQ